MDDITHHSQGPSADGGSSASEMDHGRVICSVVGVDRPIRFPETTSSDHLLRRGVDRQKRSLRRILCPTGVPDL